MSEKNPKEVALELLKMIKSEVEEKQKEFTPMEAVKALATGLREAVNEYEKQIVDMKKKEDLNKSLFGLPSSTPSNVESGNKSSWQAPNCKKCGMPFKSPLDVILARPNGICNVCAGIQKCEKTVFEILNKSAPPGREEQVLALKPKVGKESAFKIAWAAHNKEKNKTKKNDEYIDPAHSNDPEKRIIEVGKNNVSLDSKKIDMPGSGGKTVFDILGKAMAQPHSFLGGKDQASKQMLGHALSSQTPSKTAAVGVKDKMPTMEEHAKRAQAYADFMPPGAFNKEEKIEMCASCKAPKKMDEKLSKLICTKCGKE